MLTPNGELAAALTDAVERHHLAAGDPVWRSPRIRDFAGWLRGRHAERLLIEESLPRTLTEVEERELWRAIVDGSPAGRDLLEPQAAARAARRARHAMADYGISETALAAHAGEETAALLQWSALFDARCRDLGCLSSDRLLALAPPPETPVQWIDSEQWRPMARRWLTLHAGAPLPPLATVPAPTRRVHCPSPGAEIQAMAEWAGEALDRDPDFRAWACMADLPRRRREVEDAFDAVLAPQRWRLGGADAAAPYALAGGVPLALHAPVRAALDLLSAAAGAVPFEAFSALLRAPEWSESQADAAAAAAADVALRSRAPHAAPLREWLRLTAALPGPSEGAGPRSAAVLQRLTASLEALETARGAQRMSRWVGIWVQAFESGPWAERQRWSSGEYQAAERLRELLATLATADAMFGSVAFAVAVRLLTRAAHDTAFQPQTGIPPIWISGQVMDPWLAYDGIWLAGFGEDRWPPPADPLPLIPVRVQRDHGVPSADPRAQLERAHELQRRWQARTGRLIASAADGADGSVSRLSSLLADPAQPPADPVPESLPPLHWIRQRQSMPRLETLIDERAPAFAPPEALRGVATLRAQSLCPFRGFAETRLRTEPLPLPTPGFNVRERGEMLHASLELIWTDLRDSARLAATVPAELADLTLRAAAAAVEHQCRKRDPGGLWPARERRRLAALLERWLEVERQRPPFEVEQMEAAAQQARHGGLEFNVRIDRIDRLEAGGRVLIDYKTGAATPDWRGERPDNPQLPVYALLQPRDLVAVAYGRVNARDCGFVAEAARGGIFKPGSRPTALEGTADFAALLELWSRRLDVIAAEVASGLAAAAPTARACTSCRLQSLCRISGTAGAGDPDESAAGLTGIADE